MPPDQLVRLLAGLRAVTVGITTHSIDYSDHYARSDRRLSRFNFLKYDDAQWRPFNSGLQYVNRLRHSDYVRLFREAGFAILEESSVPGEPARRDCHRPRSGIAADVRRDESCNLVGTVIFALEAGGGSIARGRSSAIGETS